MEKWDDIRVFLAVGRSGSLSGAARVLRTSQPTVGRKIAEMEEHLGVKLFDRLHDGLRLTRAGHEIWDHASRIEAQTLAIERTVGGLDMRLEGPVRISATEGLAALWLVPRLRPFQQRNSALMLEVIADNATIDLNRSEADIALRLSRPKPQNLIARRVGILTSHLFAARRYLEAEGAPDSFDDLAHHDVVDFTWNLGRVPRNAWQRLVQNHKRLVLRSNSSFANLAAVRAGYGIGLLPNYVAPIFPELQRLLPDYPWPSQEIWLVWHEDLNKAARLRQTLDEIVRLFAEDQQWFGPQAPDVAAGEP